MISKIFRRKDGSYTLNEFELKVQNKSVIPSKYSPSDKYQNYRREAKK
jgi:rRNA maturation protein Nop10